MTAQVLKNRLSKEEFDKVIKESYRTLISFKAKPKKGQLDDEDLERKENLKKKYAKFTTQVLSQNHQLHQPDGASLTSSAAVSQLDGATRTATTDNLHLMLVEAVKSSQISGSQSIHHQRSSSYYRDEKNQILDLLSGETGRLDSYRTGRGSQSDVISN